VHIVEGDLCSINPLAPYFTLPLFLLDAELLGFGHFQGIKVSLQTYKTRTATHNNFSHILLVILQILLAILKFVVKEAKEIYTTSIGS
jgi:hypothetical protein